MKIKTLIFSGLFLSSLSSLAEVYSGSVMVDSNRGPRPMSITYKFDATNKSNLKGVVEFTRDRGGPCWSSSRSIDGSIIKGDEITLSATSSSEHESLGCGTFDLVGKLEGNKIIGKFKMQGKPYEIVLTKD